MKTALARDDKIIKLDYIMQNKLLLDTDKNQPSRSRDRTGDHPELLTSSSLSEGDGDGTSDQKSLDKKNSKAISRDRLTRALSRDKLISASSSAVNKESNLFRLRSTNISTTGASNPKLRAGLNSATTNAESNIALRFKPPA